jgi:AdoMet-dependent rRNA methyltransferase SPB1
VSSEIFVVCEGYLAPQTVDPKLLDPKFAFADLVRKDKKEIMRRETQEEEKKPSSLFVHKAVML